MIIPISEINKVFEKILKKQIQGQYCTAILVSYDTDAICSFQIISEILKLSGVLYNVFPCQGFMQMNQILDSLESNASLRNIILINCGAVVNLTDRWFSAVDSNVKTFILDNHRPIQHENVHSKKKIIVIDDMISNLDECPKPETVEYIIKTQNGINIEEENINEQEDDEEEEQFEEEGSQDGDSEIQSQKRKKQSVLHRKINKKQKLEADQASIDKYYKGYYYGYPTTILALKMARQQSKENNDTIWLAILGLTDLYIHQKIEQQVYNQLQQELQTDVRRKFGIANQEFQDDQNIQKYDSGFTWSERDYRFMLLKHWNLYDAIKYSNTVAPQLGIWHDKSKKGELDSLITKLGIPLSQAKQDYKFMDYTYKQQLKQKLLDIGEQFKLDELLFESFVRQVDQKVQLTATDVVHCISTILECPKSVLQQIFQDYTMNLKKKQKTEEQKDNEETNQQQLQQEQKEDNRTKNFYWALDVIKEHLNGKTQLLMQGITIAKEFQMALVNEAMFLFERKGIEVSHNFRLALLKKEGVQNKKYFQQSFQLQKLALYIMEVYKSKKSTQKSLKPIVLACQNQQTNSYTVVGVVPYIQTDATGFQTKNDFGHKFQNVVNEHELNYFQNDFDTCVIEIGSQDIDKFLDELTIN